MPTRRSLTPQNHRPQEHASVCFPGQKYIYSKYTNNQNYVKNPPALQFMNFRFQKEKQRLKILFKTLFRLHDLWVNKSDIFIFSDFQKKFSIIFLGQSSVLLFAIGVVRPCVNETTVFNLGIVISVKQIVEILTVKVISEAFSQLVSFVKP